MLGELFRPPVQLLVSRLYCTRPTRENRRFRLCLLLDKLDKTDISVYNPLEQVFACQSYMVAATYLRQLGSD